MAAASASVSDEQLNEEATEKGYSAVEAYLLQGKFAEALKLLKIIEQYVNDALNQGSIDDKQLVLEAAVFQGNLFVNLSPQFTEFGLFYADNLHLIAEEPLDYLQTIRECIRSLSIHNPNEKQDLPTISKLQQILNQSKVAFKFIDYDQKLHSFVDLLVNNNLQVTSAKLSEQLSEATESVVPKLIFKNRKLVEPRNEDFTNVLDYCNAMTIGEKQNLLNIRIDDLKAHSEGGKILSEAIEFGKKNGTWKFYGCCICGRRYDKDSLINHIWGDHIPMDQLFPEELRLHLPSKVSSEWENMLLARWWTPADIGEKMEIIHVKDSEREEILEKVGEICKQLVEQELLTSSFFEVLLEIIEKDLLPKVLPQKQHGMIDGLVKTPLCFRLLGPPQLGIVLKVLQEIWDFSCSIDHKPSVFLQNDGHVQVVNGVESKESVVFSSDFSCLLMDERVLKRDLSSDDDLAAAYAVGDGAKFVNWLSTRTESDEVLAAWRCCREIQTSKGVSLFMAAESEFTCLKYLCMIKQAYGIRETLFDSLEQTLNDELSNRCVPRKLSDKLRNRLADIKFDTKNDANTIIKSFNNEVESDLISCILNEIEKIVHEKEMTEEEQLGEEGYAEAFNNVYENQPFTKLSGIDAMIMRQVADIRQQESKMEVASAFDLRVIIVSFIKNFIWAQLRELADKNVKEKEDMEIGG